MLELPGYPLLDKRALIGGCVRVPLRFDAVRLRQEIEALPPAHWGTRGGRVGVHRQAEAIFLRGHAPAEGDRPIEDRPVLDQLPYARELIERLIPGVPMRSLLAKLPAGGTVAPHIDQAPYFHQTLRLHLPVITHEHAHMLCDGLFYRMTAGEIWALNNVAVHAVWNADSMRSRTHLICDFVPDAALLALVAQGERDLGRDDPALAQAFAQQLDAQRAAPAA